ncbi:MAG: substrate-binding domain-containing protein, partial [Pseudomonadota bacterium]
QYNAEAESRLRAYHRALERHGLPFDPALVVTGTFMHQSGKAAMQRLLDAGVPFDGVVAANDAMALGAIEMIRARGLRTPRDLRVVGFDDLLLARLGNPPLTTVAQPFHAIADRALELVLDQLEGKPVPEVSVLPTELKIRRSCGCEVAILGDRASRRPVSTSRRTPLELLDARTNELHAALTLVLRSGTTDPANAATRLLTGLREELTSEPEAFTRAVEELIAESPGESERYRVLQLAITRLREELSEARCPELEDVWYGALSLISFSNTAAQTQHRLAVDENYLCLLTSGEQVAVAFDVPSLRTALVKGLPIAGVRTAFLSRWRNEPHTELEPFLCLVDGAQVDPGVEAFPADRLFPSGLLPSRLRHTLLVFPLTFETRNLGVAVFLYSPGIQGYHVLRDQVSKALMTVGLHQELMQRTMLHERSVQERLATARRLQSLGVLAGGVAHDLNNALGPLVALPDVILSELDELGLGDEAADIRADIESIKSAALRATQTIKDLLTLGRQGKTSKGSLDLNEIVASCTSAEALRFIGEINPAVRVNVDLSTEPLVVHASGAHLERAITNLVRNAVEATRGEGEVVVRTASVHVTRAASGYEMIEPGHYAVVSVIDEGDGIAEAALGRIFEPFFSSKRVNQNSGTGLGLAIVHGVVKEHAGFVDVTSTPGVGTTFTLYFPIGPALPRSEAPGHVAGQCRARVLVVDDDPAQLRTARRVLTYLGHHVETADSGKKAIAILLEAARRDEPSPYDLLVLDVILNEEHDGLDVLAQIQRHFPEQRAILASGHAPSERAEQAVARGLTWLVKPYTTEALARAIEQALSSAGASHLSLRPHTVLPPSRSSAAV